MGQIGESEKKYILSYDTQIKRISVELYVI